MSKTILTFLLTFSCLCCLSAQSGRPEKKDSAEVHQIMVRTAALCSPGIINHSRSRGVDIAYNFINGGPIRPEDNGLAERPGELESLQSIIVKARLPVINSPDFKMLVGFNYVPETYTFSTFPVSKTFSTAGPNFSDVFQDIHTRKLKDNSLNLYAMKSLNERFYAAFRLRLGYSGDYNGVLPFQNRYASYQGAAIFGVKKNPNLEYGFGLTFSKNFRRTLALPFFLYNRNFNEKWGMEAVFPALVDVRYNLDKRTILLLGYAYQSSAYSLDIQNRFTGSNHVYHLNHSEVLLGFSLERQIMPWVWANLRGGYQVNLTTRFDAQSPDAVSYKFRPPNAPFLRMGLFISPLDHLYK